MKARLRFADPNLDEIAGLLVGTHPRAADYIAQAPVLAVLAPERFGSHLTYGEMDRFGELVASEPKLRDVMQAYQAPATARKFAADAIRLKDRAAIVQMLRLDGSTLSQVLPEPSGQRVVLDGIAKWLKLAPSGKREAKKFNVAWIARQLHADPSRVEIIDNLIDFLGHGDGVLNERWTWDRAISEVAAWHVRLNDERAFQKLLGSKANAALFEMVVCKAPLPDVASVEGFDFIALRTPRAIREEGITMHHCVASYVGAVRSGQCAIVSIRRDGLNVATLEISRRGTVAQMKSHCNAAPSKAVRAAAEMYALLHWHPTPESEVA